jgi:hypothetical protein
MTNVDERSIAADRDGPDRRVALYQARTAMIRTLTAATFDGAPSGVIDLLRAGLALINTLRVRKGQVPHAALVLVLDLARGRAHEAVDAWDLWRREHGAAGGPPLPGLPIC